MYNNALAKSESITTLSLPIIDMRFIWFWMLCAYAIELPGDNSVNL